MYKFKITNPVVREMVFKRIFSLGAKMHKATKWEELVKNYSNNISAMTYCFIDSRNFIDWWTTSQGGWLGEKERNYPTLTLDMLFADDFKLLKENIIKVTLNSQYIADVSSNGVKVGCTTFSLGIIDALVEARNKIKK